LHVASVVVVVLPIVAEGSSISPASLPSQLQHLCSGWDGMGWDGVDGMGWDGMGWMWSMECGVCTERGDNGGDNGGGMEETMEETMEEGWRRDGGGTRGYLV